VLADKHSPLFTHPQRIKIIPHDTNVAAVGGVLPTNPSTASQRLLFAIFCWGFKIINSDLCKSTSPHKSGINEANVLFNIITVINVSMAAITFIERRAAATYHSDHWKQATTATVAEFQ
jgi:hypothetical protein